MRPARSTIFTTFAAVLTLWLSAGIGMSQPLREVTALKDAMTAMRDGKWDRAMELGGRAGPVGRDIIDWHRLRAGKGKFDEVTAFLERRADWPGLPYLRQRSEGRAPYRRRAGEVVAFFDAQPPRTGAGSIMLAAAFEALDETQKAEDQLILAWTTQRLSTGDESYMMERYRALLKPHHVARLDMLLWRGEIKTAQRMIPRVPKAWQALAQARIALRDEKNGVDKLIEAVPEELTDHPGLAFERFQWRARKGRNDGAIELLLARPATPKGLGEPERWAGWRRSLARAEMRAGRGEQAYRIASGHALSEGSSYADLEWLSGYLALKYLDDPELALAHFQRFRVSVQSPISLGRAGYWEGRAHEALGNADEAAVAYAFGAEHQTSFYGLLAAERAGLPMQPELTGVEAYPEWASAAFVGSSVLEAALLLQKAGERRLAARFLAHLAETQEPVGMGQIAEFALAVDEPYATVAVAKRAAQIGVVLPRVYFPVIDLGVEDMPVPEELALAIARRESEFDGQARSGVGALGLMQVMPPTAKEVAGSLKIKYDRRRLLSDPVYNARIGTAYLAGLIDMFGPNMVLVAAAYNAGPGRAERWIAQNGDPRSAGVDVVDWIEHIPFDETRNYVMRVMESLPVYRARLTGRTAPITLSQELKAR